MTQATQIRKARAFVDGALAEFSIANCQLPIESKSKIGNRKSAMRECSICGQPKPATDFRQVIGRITTEACGDCCDRRDEVDNLRDPLGPAAVAEFCLLVAMKRFERRTMLLPRNGSQQKEKSALAKDPSKYAAWLQKFPDRVAAIVAKTYAEMGDDAFAHGVPDDVALVMIRDLLNEGDDTLISRNANKRLARPRQSS